jgi:hypothetical protein
MKQENRSLISIVGLATSLLIGTTVVSIATDTNSTKSSEVKRTGGDVVIQIPTVPTPIKPIEVTTVGGNAPVTENIDKYKLRAMAMSGNRPPEAKSADKPSTATNEVKVGDVQNSRVSSYLRGELQSVESVTKLLKDANFTILSTMNIDKKGKLTSIVFTNDALTKMVDKSNRGFAGTIRVLVNQKDNEIAFNNPLYLSKAFMQDDFDPKVVDEVLDSIRGAFPNLRNCKDKLKFNLLPKYHFMASMPYYQDMIVLAKADTNKALLDSIKTKKQKKIIFRHQISKERMVIGIRLSKRTSKFINKIGTKNSQLLPYPILIENGEAKIMDPKYYIAIMYPELKMSEFMTIATIPDAIESDSKKIFR